MSQLPIIQKQQERTDANLVLKLEIHILNNGPDVSFYWNDLWANTANPAWPHQVFLVALQALWAAGLTILAKVTVPGMAIKTSTPNQN